MLTTRSSYSRVGVAFSKRHLPLLSALAFVLWVAPMRAQGVTPSQAAQIAQSSASSPSAHRDSNNSAPMSTAGPTSTPEPPRPDWLPKGAVWEGTGWSVPTPLPSQYESFFAWSLHLEEQAELHEKAGKDGSWLRNHLEESIGLSPAEVELVHDAAHRDQEQTKAFNEEIVAAIMANRANYPPNAEVPLPAESIELEKQRDEATMRIVAELKEKLGPDSTTKLETWRQKYWSGPRKVEHGSLPPGAEQAWRELNQKRLQEMQRQLHRKYEEQQKQKEQTQQNGQEVQP